MTNLEWVKNNAKDYNLNERNHICQFAHISKYKSHCGIKYKCCGECELNNNLKKVIDYLLEEHKEPIKLKKWEYDLIKAFYYSGYENWMFKELFATSKMKQFGYFKNVKDENIKIDDLFKNCEVEDE